MHRLQAGTPNKKGWYEARSTEGLFRVELPIPFNDFTIAAKDKEGRDVFTYGIGSASAERITFGVTEARGARRKAESPEDALKSFVASFRIDGNTISEEKYFQYAGHPAVQFKLASTQSSASMRFIILPDRVFLLIVECPSAQRGHADTLINPFFESLEILEATPAKSARRRPRRVDDAAAPSQGLRYLMEQTLDARTLDHAPGSYP